MTFLSGFGEKIALRLTLDLVKASAAVVRRRLGKSDAKAALEAAIAQALDEAVASIDAPADLSDHYASLLGDFFRREEVVEELAKLLDPRPDVELDFAALTEQFEAEHDSASLEHLDLAAFLRAFASAFYAAAASQPELKSNLEMKLLGEMVKRTGLTVQATERTAAATEQMAGLLQKYLEDQNGKDALLLAAHEARNQGMIAAFQALEGIAAGMFKAGFDFGVGRTGLIEIGGNLKALPPAQADTIRTLAADLRRTVLDANPGPAELDALEQRYRQHIIRWFENLQFQGLMRAPRPIVLPLEDVYVELRAVAEVPDAADAFSVEERRLLLEVDDKNPGDRREMMSQLDALRRERWSRTLPERKSIAESLHQRDRRAFVILGDPGSGKTTLLHFLALVYARGPQTAAERLKIDLSEADRLPIFVPLAAFDDMRRESWRAGGSLTLLDFLSRYYDRRRGLPGLEPLFRRALTSGRAIILLDGLDEVIDPGTRGYIAQQAGALINEWSPRGVRFAVSSRFVGYREAPVSGNLPTLSVLDFGMPEIEIFVHRWAEAYEKWAANGESPEMFRRARTLETDLFTDVKSNESVSRLAANPLMITMLALLRRQVGRLPHRRVQLYESYVGALLENWVDARSQGAREQSVEILDRHQAENLLIPLALWLQQEKPSGTAGRAEIQQKLTEICLEEAGLTGKATRPQTREAEDKALRFLQEMRQMTGLLIERGHDAFGFLHLTFQEYFAGRALARLSDEERLNTVRPNRHDPRWREPILLCAGRLGIVENRRPQVTEFVRGILDCPDSTEEKLHRNLLLALAIAGDDVNLDPGLMTEMVGRAVGCLPTRIETLAKGLVGALGQLVANGAVGAEECFGLLLASEYWWQQQIVVEALGRFAGVETIRGLLSERCAAESQDVVVAALEALSSQVGLDEKVRQNVLDKLLAEESQVRSSAVRVLGGLAETDHAVRKAILERLEDFDDNVHEAASRALAGIVGTNEEVRRAVLSKLADARSYVRAAAISALSEAIGPDEEVRRAVLSKLGDPNDSVRRAAVNGLSGAVGFNEEVRRAVLAKLDDSSDSVRLAAISGLAGAVGSDEEVRRAVLSKLEDTDLYARQVAISALSGEVGFNDDVRQAVLSKLGDSSSNVRQVAISALSGIVTTHQETRRVLLAKLAHGSEEEKLTLLRILSALLISDPRANGALKEQSTSISWRVRRSLAEVLGDNAGSPESLAMLGELLENRNVEEASALLKEVNWPRRLAGKGRRAWWLDRVTFEITDARAGAAIAPEGRADLDEEELREVLRRLEDENFDSRRSALSALSVVVGMDDKVCQAVMERLGDNVSSVRKAAVKALASVFGKIPEATQSIVERLSDQNFSVRLAVIEVIARGPSEVLAASLLARLLPWLMVDSNSYDNDARTVRAQLASLFGARISSDPSLRVWLLAKLRDPRWSARLGAALTLRKGPDGSSDEILDSVFEAFEDRRGLEAYPAQLAAASFLINRDKYSQDSIDLCLEALDYGTQAWEYRPEGSGVRQQAALVLGKLEPLFFHERVYDKLLQVMENDQYANVVDAAYGALVRLARVREQVGASQRRSTP